MFSTTTRAQRVAIAQENKQWIITQRYDIPLTASYTMASVLSCPFVSKAPNLSVITLMAQTTDDAIVKSWNTRLQNEEIDANNFANARNVGGGFLQGDATQEEELMRTCPTLFPSLQRSTYPFQWNQDLKYTTDVTVIRDSSNQYKPFSNDQIAHTNIITAAAPDRRWMTGDKWTHEDMEYLATSICRIPLLCSTQAMSKPRTLILGAIGCGAFQNSPQENAAILVKAASEVSGYYRRIIFAIPDSNGTNYQAFKTEIDGLSEIKK